MAQASFSALQRAEIAEMLAIIRRVGRAAVLVSVLFNEPKLLKSRRTCSQTGSINLCFSALQRAEIAEIPFDFARPNRR